jgi:hypothetical protein
MNIGAIMSLMTTITELILGFLKPLWFLGILVSDKQSQVSGKAVNQLDSLMENPTGTPICPSSGTLLTRN